MTRDDLHTKDRHTKERLVEELAELLCGVEVTIDRGRHRGRCGVVVDVKPSQLLPGSLWLEVRLDGARVYLETSEVSIRD